MMNQKKYLCLLMFILCCFFIKAGNADWRKIENRFYSLELPVSWVPMQGMPGDGTEPGEREVRGYHLYYFAWQTPVESTKEIPKCIGIDIQTYRKSDNSSLSVKDIEKAVVVPVSPIRNGISSLKDELRIVVLKDSKEMDGSIIKYRRYYLLKQAGIGVHCVQISLRDELVKSKPATEKLIKRIMDSFTVKSLME